MARASAAMHQKARELASQAFLAQFGRAPTPNELRILQAVSLFETTYGAGWHGEGVASNNMGAITGSPGFTYRDSNAAGEWYTTTFRAYSTPLEGWTDLVHELFVRRPKVYEAAKSGDIAGVAREMRATGYYTGIGADEPERIESYRRALEGVLVEIDAQPGAGASGPARRVAVADPGGTVIGVAVVSEAVAPGLEAARAQFGDPYLIAYPNGWRVLQFGPGVALTAKRGLPFELAQERSSGPTWGWAGGAWLGIAGLVATIFYGTLTIKPHVLANPRKAA